MAVVFHLVSAGCIEIAEEAMREIARTHIEEGLSASQSLAEILAANPAGENDQHFQTMYCLVFARVRLAMRSKQPDGNVKSERFSVCR